MEMTDDDLGRWDRQPLAQGWCEDSTMDVSFQGMAEGYRAVRIYLAKAPERTGWILYGPAPGHGPNGERVIATVHTAEEVASRITMEAGIESGQLPAHERKRWRTFSFFEAGMAEEVQQNYKAVTEHISRGVK